MLGIQLIKNLVVNPNTAYWWLDEGRKRFEEIQWVPKIVPTLIIGGEKDFLTPISCFQQDKRFHRDNIQMNTLPNAGHFPWIEQPGLITKAFELYYRQLA